MILKFQSSAVRYINVDRYISSDISRRDLHAFYGYVSRRQHTNYPTDLKVICYLPMDIAQRNWKYGDIYKTMLPVIC